MDDLPAASRGRSGRPEYKPQEGEPQLVRILAANGVPHAIIGSFLKIDVKTLKKHFKHELLDGRGIITARLGLTAVQKALAGDNEMLKFWLRTHGGPEWRPSTEVQLTGANGESLKPPNLVIGFLKPKVKPDDDQGDGGTA